MVFLEDVAVYLGRGDLVNESPIGLPEEWGRFVDEPLTGKELERFRVL